jgi:long-chain acyl-CoA synthetase
LEQKSYQETETKASAESILSEEDENVLFGENKALDYPSRQRIIDRYGTIRGELMPPNELDHASDPLINKLRTVRDTLTNCPQLWAELANICPERTALIDDHLCDEKIKVDFAEMNEIVRKSAAVFADLGIKKGNNVAVLGENSARWLMIDHGIQLAGGASAVRGADAPIDELLYIYEHSDSAGVAVVQGPKLLKKLAKNAKSNGLSALGLKNDSFGPVRTVVLMHREKHSDEDIAKLSAETGVQIKVFSDLLAKTAPIDADRVPKIGQTDIATIVYTSGTTGRPKGVMLSHGNMIHQMGHRLSPTQKYEDSEPLPGDTMVSLLPVWHITERTFEMWMSSRACSIVYSSIRTFKKDMAIHKPQWMVLVPRVLEKIALGVQDKFAAGSAVVQTLVKVFTATSSAAAKQKKIAKGLVVGGEQPGALEKLAAKASVALLAPINAVGDKLVWSKVKDGFGGRLKVIISGGSALAGSLEDFYETVGMKICVGYGLTECSPLIAYRRADANLVTAGCAGKACIDTELRVVDPESKANKMERPALPHGEPGVVLARGPQVMQGYYKNPEATAKAIDKFGWFDTGDVGRINPVTGDLILTGRAKDTIVLSNGENIEPVPIEDAVLGGSPLIEQVMLTGQDGRRLVAVVVLRPEELGNAGYLEKAEATKLQEAYEHVNDPKCSEEESEANCKILNEVVPALQANKELKKALMADIKAATSSFRAWEQVGDIHITIEPFAMANGLLTQSYKVKRDAVMARHGADLPK